MKSGIQYKQGDIVIVPFPFTNLAGIKQRPVLIFSNNAYNAGQDVITRGITSNIRDSPYSVLIDSTSLETGTIPVTSRIKIDKIFTLHTSLIRKKIASLKPEIMNKVKEEFKKVV